MCFDFNRDFVILVIAYFNILDLNGHYSNLNQKTLINFDDIQFSLNSYCDSNDNLLSHQVFLF